MAKQTFTLSYRLVQNDATAKSPLPKYAAQVIEFPGVFLQGTKEAIRRDAPRAITEFFEVFPEQKEKLKDLLKLERRNAPPSWNVIGEEKFTIEVEIAEPQIKTAGMENGEKVRIGLDALFGVRRNPAYGKWSEKETNWSAADDKIIEEVLGKGSVPLPTSLRHYEESLKGDRVRDGIDALAVKKNPAYGKWTEEDTNWGPKDDAYLASLMENSTGSTRSSLQDLEDLHRSLKY